MLVGSGLELAHPGADQFVQVAPQGATALAQPPRQGGAFEDQLPGSAVRLQTHVGEELERAIPQHAESAAELGPGGKEAVPVLQLVIHRHAAPPSVAAISALPCTLRNDSPRNSKRCALCTRRSRIESATVGSPTGPCQRSIGSCDVRIVARSR